MKKILISLIIMFITAGCACSHQPDASGAPDPVTLETAAKYMEEGEYGKAIESYSALISEDSSNAEYYLGRARAYAASGTDEENTEAAIADCRSALEKNEYLADGYLMLAQLYERQDDAESAAQVLQEGITALSADDEYEEDLQALEGQLAKISEESGEQTAADQAGELLIADFTYEFNAGDKRLVEDAAGVLIMDFSVTGPQDTCTVSLIGWGEEIQDPGKEAAYAAEASKNGEPDSDERHETLPFKMRIGFPVMEEDLGKTFQVLFVGFDRDWNLTGYTVVTVKTGE